MTRGPPVRHEQPWKTWKTSLPLSLAVEQSHKDDLTRSQLRKVTTPGGKGSVGQGGPTPCHTHLRPTSLQSTVQSSWDYCGSNLTKYCTT